MVTRFVVFQETYCLPGPAMDSPSQRADFGGCWRCWCSLLLRRHERREGGEGGAFGSDWSEGSVVIWGALFQRERHRRGATAPRRKTHQMRSVPSSLGNDRRSLPAPLSLAKRQSRHASENPRGFRKKHNGNHISRVVGVGLAIVTPAPPQSNPFNIPTFVRARFFVFA
jgi:hypothetical protein